MSTRIFLGGLALAGGTAVTAVAEDLTHLGLSGVIDVPTATMPQADSVGAIYDWSENRRTLSFGFQWSERVEVGLAFPTFDTLGGTTGDDDLSVKIRLLDEGDLAPALALGLTGLTDNDRGSGEFLAATKTFGPVEATVGLGWGRFAGASPASRGPTDENFSFEHLFQGESAVFGGLRWETPIDGLTLLAEYSYDPSGAAGFDGTGRMNYGLSYTVVDGITVAGYAREDGDFGIRLSFYGNPSEDRYLRDPGPGPFPFVTRPGGEVARGWAASRATRRALENQVSELLEDNNIRVTGFAVSETDVRISVRDPGEFNAARTIGRTARVLSAVMPASVETFRIYLRSGPFDTTTVALDRAALEEAADKPDAGLLAWNAVTLESTPFDAAGTDGSAFTPGFDYGITPRFRADITGDDQVGLTGTLLANARYDFSPTLRVEGALGYRFLNQWEQQPPPVSPAPRSDSTSYTPDQIYLDSLTISQLFKVAPDVYGRVSGGYFERQYGGLSGELLWRPPDTSYAFGVEATYGVKRDYEDWFAFQDYEVSTLIASGYFSFGDSGTNLQVDVGKYIADDFGVAVTLGRTFTNGWEVAFRTAWSEDLDDELSFGIRVDVPLSWAAPTGTMARAGIGAGGPGTKDAAAAINGTGRLYGTISDTDAKRLEDGWGEFWN